jgi:hypothetical protein
MTNNTYVGVLEDGNFTLTANGKVETPDAYIASFSWGRKGAGTASSRRTALRILSREIPAPMIYMYMQRFEEEVLDTLPARWKITSDDIRRWLNNHTIKENIPTCPEATD